jgi:hypothetical protein
MKKVTKMSLYLMSLLCYLSSASSQTDTINKYNSKGKKQGYWTCYLDKDLKKTNVSNAYYYAYELFDSGINLTKISQRGIKKYSVIAPVDMGQQVVPITLNGVFILTAKNGRTRSVEEYKNGYPYILKAYESNPATNETNFEVEYLDYTRKYENQVGSFYWEYRSFKRNDTTRFWFRKIDGKWRDVKIE